MPCLLAIMTFFTPRLVLILVTLFSDFMGRAYMGWMWPILGFVFMPLTTLAYACALNWHGNVDGSYFFMVLCASLADLGVVGGGVRLRRILPF
jgi:hypothetical protein